MIVILTNRRLRVSIDGHAGPYIMIPLPQPDELKYVLHRNQISFVVDPEAIILDGEPEIVNLGRAANTAKVQRILDSED